MKIGIITLPFHTNYGGIIQAFALQNVLQGIGNEVYIIEKKQIRYSKIRMALSIAKQVFKKYVLFRDVKHINVIRYDELCRNIIQKHTKRFIEEYLNVVTIAKYEYCHKFNLDVLVVGSDQVWNPMQSVRIEEYFLSFAKGWNIKRLAYAASFGTDKLELSSEQIEEYRGLLEKFAYVSVREYSGVDLCQKYFKVNARKVLDPTFLLEATKYDSLLKNVMAERMENTLLTYILFNNNAIQTYINEMATYNHFNVIASNNVKRNDPTVDLNDRIQPSLEQWLYGIKNASLVITDSFHACVFSIIFNTPFLVVKNNTRIDTLLMDFGLEKCLNDNFKILPVPIIDWETVNYKKRELIEASLDFLKKSLA